MKNTVILLVVLIVIAAAAYMFTMDRNVAESPLLGDPVVESSNEDVSSAEEREVRGTVVSVNSEQVPVDGPTLVTIEEENGDEVVIAIPSMGINLCAAQDNIVDLGELESGVSVEVRGQVGEEGMIIPCESALHYVRIVTQ